MKTVLPISGYKAWSTTELLAALPDSDRLALAELYERYWFALYRVAYRKTDSHETAEELVQDLFVELWQKRATLQVRQADAYLFTALRYAVIDHIRKQVQQERFAAHTPPDSGQATTDNLMDYNDLVGRVEEKLREMPAKTGQIFRLSRYDDQPIPAIAKTLSLSEKTVEYHLSKALKTLRAHLQEFAMLFVVLYW
jgi:RNA polymerase sigma-70 factor (family 1)